MANVTTYLLFIILSIVIVAHADSEHGAHAVSYDTESFTAALKSKPNFVMFYAPWCGHCKNLAPTWDELAKLYNNIKDSPVVIAKVDCTVHTDLCASQEIVGFPTLKLFLEEQPPKRYAGKRDLESLKVYVERYVKVKEDAIPEDTVTKPAPPDVQGVVTLTDDTFHEHIEFGVHFVKFYAPWCGHCKRLAPTWDELAKAFSNDETNSIAKIDCTESSVICPSQGIQGYPTLFLFKDGKKVEEYQGSRNLESLKTFFQEYITKVEQEDDEPAAETKEDEAVEDEEGVVKDLTADNFDSFLQDHQLVFVKFFAPWCGHCKRLAPTWDELAKEVAGSQVAIAKVDCTQHKSVCDNNNVRGYPTLQIFKDGVKLEDYRSHRSLEELTNFVQNHMEKLHDEL